MEHLLHEITPWVMKYGLWIVFFGMIVEGTVMIIITGLLCYLGMLPLKDSIFVAIIGAIVGDQIWYLIGRYASYSIIGKFSRLKEGIDRLSDKISKRGDYFALTSRFIYSGAIIFPMSLGISRYSHIRFIILDSIGVSIWAIVGISIGYLFSASAEKIFGEIQTIEHLLFFILAIVVIVATFKYYLKRE